MQPMPPVFVPLTCPEDAIQLLEAAQRLVVGRRLLGAAEPNLAQLPPSTQLKMANSLLSALHRELFK